MKNNLVDFQKIAIAVHPKNDQAYKLAEKIAASLTKDGKQILLGRMDEKSLRDGICNDCQDLLIALGGDGTMLRAGHICAPTNTPILGINLGRFGFLTEIQKDEWKNALKRVLRGDYWLEKRMMLLTSMYRGDEKIGQWNALNDAVISRGETIRPVQFEIFINTRQLSTIVADAVITSTATGSTAYAMAAGGPILSPELRNIILVPVAPHLSIEQSLVLSEDVLVSVTVHTSHQAVISIDGQPPVDMKTGDRVEIQASDYAVQFIRFQDPGYFYRNLIPYMDQNPSIKKNNV
ncbi:MAG: NAD(+)/NADH kinase [Anaerolineales bacterium]|nr:NAD(+)/NADH kinase [Anaerolineales bacterium]